MSLDRRLSKLEESPATRGQGGQISNVPLYSQSDFREEDDPDKLLEMFDAMWGRWHLVECEEDGMWESLSDDQLEEMTAGETIRWEKISDRELAQIASGCAVADVLGPNWQKEYLDPHAGP